MSEKAIQIKFNGTRIFNATMNSKARIVVNRGGAGSSKSVSVLQVLLLKFLREKRKKILIIRKTLPSLRTSTHEAFMELLSDNGLTDFIRQEKQFLNYYYGSNKIHFGSVDDPEKIKSSNYSYIFMEEATDFTYNDFQLLKLRLREPSVDGVRNQMFLAFNPVDEFHWIKDKVLEGEAGVEEIHSTYRDNPYLDDEYISDLEALINQDPNYHRIYTLGQWGKLENLIYRNWKAVEFYKERLHDKFYGLDFGFNAPSALIEISPEKDSSDIYLKELIYQSKLTNAQLIERMKKLIPRSKRHRPIYCDSAEPDRIKEIRLAGFNAKEAKKNVQDGIDFVKRKNLKILKSDENIIKEVQSYSYKVDKDGNVKNDDPVDFMNHALDAIRYGIYTHLGRNRKVGIRWL
jgi:phage terminase large subunit